MSTNVTNHHVIATPHAITTMADIHARVTMAMMATVKHASTLTNVLTHRVPKSHVECATIPTVVIPVVVITDMKVTDTTAMTSTNVKTQTPAQRMLPVVTPTVASFVNVTWATWVTVMLNAMILTSVKSQDQTTVASMPPVATLLAVLNVLVSRDTLVMVPSVHNSTIEPFSTRVQTCGYAQPGTPVQCIAVRTSTSARTAHATNEPHAQTPAEASNANAEKASRVTVLAAMIMMNARLVNLAVHMLFAQTLTVHMIANVKTISL
jgi:hypothetical protein